MVPAIDIFKQSDMANEDFAGWLPAEAPNVYFLLVFKLLIAYDFRHYHLD